MRSGSGDSWFLQAPDALRLSGARLAPPSDDASPRTVCSGTAARVRSPRVLGDSLPSLLLLSETIFSSTDRDVSKDAVVAGDRLRFHDRGGARPNPLAVSAVVRRASDGVHPLALPASSRANANDRLPRASLGRVEGGDGIVEGRDGAD